MTFPQLSDPDGEVFAHFDVVAQPAFVVISPSGEATALPGALDEDELEDALADATAG